MPGKATPIGVSILIASLLAGCTGGSQAKSPYPPVLLTEAVDPLARPKDFTPWRPPRQMAAFIHPHEDREQGVMIAGHWIMVLLGEGSWYFQGDADHDPIPDGEAGEAAIRAALGAVSVPRDAVVPYRAKEGGKP